MKVSLLFAACLVLARLGDNAVLAQEPEHFASAEWVSAQLSKRADASTELRHTIGGSDLPPIVDGRPGRKPSPSTPSYYEGSIVLDGPASKVNNLAHQTSPWTIVGCNPSSDLTNGQTVLAYCKSKNPKVDCAGLFIGGAKETIVTLPITCGAPFGRIVKFDPTATSQLPASELAKLGSAAKDVSVFVMQFDYEFQKIPWKKGDGEVSLTIDVGTFDGGLSPMAKRNDDLQVLDRRYTLNRDEHIPLTRNFDYKIANLTKACQGFSLDLQANVAGKLDGKLSVGYHVTGTILPPRIKEHRAYLKAHSSMDVTLTMSGLIKYEFPKLDVPIFPTTGIPGFSIPGIITLGPYVKANLRLSGDIAVDGKITAQTTLTLPSADISIGENSAKPPVAAKGAEFGRVNITEGIELSATLKITVVPQIGVGVQVLKGLVDAKVALEPNVGLAVKGSADLDKNSIQAPSTISPCIELDAHLGLDYAISGKVGPWGKDKNGVIWGYDKQLYKRCFNKGKPDTINSKKRALEIEALEWHTSDTLWKRAAPEKGPNCPSKRPFTK